MKRIYKRIEVASSEILLTLALFSDVGGAESVDAADLDRLEAQLSRPNYTGAEQLLVANVQRSHLEITNEGEVLAVLHRLKRGENVFVCKARYGTNISVQLTIDFVVTDPNETTPVEISEDVVLVESIGDGGGGGGEFPTDYAKQGTDPDATLTATQVYAQSAASDAGAAKTAAEAAKDAAQAIAIPSDYSKQGADPTATNSAILAAVQSISDIESDVQAGRQALATNITAKGVPTSVSDALVTMATKVLQIPQQLNTGISEFEQMIAPSPYMWNVYTVATDLMKETLPQYIPSYMSSSIYTQYRANNAFFVGEYYLGYDTLELMGADGYLTCDGHFYTITGEIGSRVVSHTLPDGNVETYSAESIVHTWTDGASGYCNRWIGFFYLGSAYSFSNTTGSICPRRVALCGECLSFVVSGANRLTDVWVIGTLGHFEGGTTGDTWNIAQVVRNYKTHTNGYFYTSFNGVSLVMSDLETASSSVLYNCDVQYVYFPALKTPNRIISGSETSLSIFDARSIELLENILIEITNITAAGASILPNLSIINLNGLVELRSNIIRTVNSVRATHLRSLKEVKLQNLETISAHLFNLVSYSSTDSNFSFPNLTELRMPSLKRCSTDLFLFSETGTEQYIKRGFVNLIDVEVGEMETSFNFKSWAPTSVLSDADKKTTLVNNVKNHILAHVLDRTGETQLTFTVSTTMYNTIASENIEWQGQTMTLADAFLTKNWLLAGA